MKPNPLVRLNHLTTPSSRGPLADVGWFGLRRPLSGFGDDLPRRELERVVPKRSLTRTVISDAKLDASHIENKRYHKFSGSSRSYICVPTATKNSDTATAVTRTFMKVIRKRGDHTLRETQPSGSLLNRTPSTRENSIDNLKFWSLRNLAKHDGAAWHQVAALPVVDGH